jgi:dUTP pyrophosphatase
MKVNFKKLNEKAVKPKFSKPGDAGADLVATEVVYNGVDNKLFCHTGLAVEIPEGMVGLIFPRSSIRNYDLSMANSVGVIDSGYRGEIMVTFNVNIENKIYHKIGVVIDEGDVNNQQDWLDSFDDEERYKPTVYQVGDRIAQLVIIPVPLIQYTEVEDLSETQRGEGGHGSTGK